MRVRLTTDPDDRVALESPYDAGLVARLKGTIPFGGREWDGSRKRWLVSVLYVTDLLQVLQACGADIQDDRTRADALDAVPPMPEDLRTAFEALFLAYTAPLCVAEGAYRALSNYWHPDRGGAAEDFQRVSAAIATIRHYLDPQPETNDDALPC